MCLDVGLEHSRGGAGSGCHTDLLHAGSDMPSEPSTPLYFILAPLQCQENGN